MGEAGYNARGGSNPSSSALAAGRLGAFKGIRIGGDGTHSYPKNLTKPHTASTLNSTIAAIGSTSFNR